MNSLNIISSRVIGQSSPSPPRARSHSQGDIRPSTPRDDLIRGRSFSDHKLAARSDEADRDDDSDNQRSQPESVDTFGDENINEKTSLLAGSDHFGPITYKSKWRQALKRIIAALAEGARILLSYIGAPAMYMVASFQDSDGRYSAFVPVKRMAHLVKASKKPAKHANGASSSGSDVSEKRVTRDQTRRLRASASRESLSSSATSESDLDNHQQTGDERSTRFKGQRQSKSEDEEPRRSIRIRLNSNESFQQRRKQRTAKAQAGETVEPSNEGQLTVDNIKSPTSPSSHKITKYPHAPQPPRPLVPRRQPSYTANPIPTSSRRSSIIRQPSHLQQKTLILDLDETLIHSLSRGGRMSSGHMVEVKLNSPVGVPGSGTIGPQHPILYYVHKRPHCDEFLRKVCKWYKLVIFTASVQEYADPVIDWLEQERKFFSARYYRQHCTFRNGAYIKDLSSVEPDLSRVCILDNSPMSYIFHEDNAIPIEGWINDPTDNDLLHLIPMLEALQYVTDFRAFLALRRGEAEAQQ